MTDTAKLSDAQLAVLNSLMEGGTIIRRGRRPNGNNIYALGRVNGMESLLDTRTVHKLEDVGAIHYTNHKITKLGRKAVEA